MTPETFWWLVVGLLALLVGFLLPLLVQLRRTAQRAEQFLLRTEQDLVPLLRELRETSERAANLARRAEEDFSRVTPFLQSLGKAGHSLNTLSGVLGSDWLRYAGSAVGFWLGLRSLKKAFPAGNPGNKEGV